MGKDNTIRSIRMRSGKNTIKRPIQLLYPMSYIVTQRQLPATPQATKH